MKPHHTQNIENLPVKRRKTHKIST